MENRLPSFTNPPIVETVTSVQFKRIRGFVNGHLGLFWSRVRSVFPEAEDREPLRLVSERTQGQLPSLEFFQLRPTDARLLLLSANGREALQIQNGRFIFNWRRLHGDRSEYPRWTTTLPRFEEHFATFRSFLRDHFAEGGEDPLVLNQWEVTYVNHLEQSRDWESPEDWPRLLPGLIGRPAGYAREFVSPVAMAGDTHFDLLGTPGRIHTDLKHLARVDDASVRMLRLEITARGPVGDCSSLASCLSHGREAIVRLFAAITGPEAHARWGMTE